MIDTKINIKTPDFIKKLIKFKILFFIFSPLMSMGVVDCEKSIKNMSKQEKRSAIEELIEKANDEAIVPSELIQLLAQRQVKLDRSQDKLKQDQVKLDRRQDKLKQHQLQLNRYQSQLTQLPDHWIQKEVAEQGDVDAQYELALAYLYGSKRKGVKVNFDRSFEWFQKAAEQGHADAQYKLAQMYLQGKGISQSNTKAGQWLIKAARKGHAQAQESVILDFRKTVSEDDQVVDLYKKAMFQDDADSQYEMGLRENGEGFDRSDSAFAWFFEAGAKQGHAGAQYELGQMYLEGKGIYQSNSKAIEWFQKAAEQGHKEAQSQLNQMNLSAE